MTVALLLASAVMAATSPPLERPARIYAVDAPLGYVFGQVAAQTKLRFNFADSVESCRVTVMADGLTTRQIMGLLLQANSFTYQQLGRSDTYTITGRKGRSCRKTSLHMVRNYCISRESLDCENSSAIGVTDLTFNRWGLGFVFTEGYVDAPMSAHIQKGTAEEVEMALNASKLPFRKVDGVFVVGPSPDADVAPQ